MRAVETRELMNERRESGTEISKGVGVGAIVATALRFGLSEDSDYTD